MAYFDSAKNRALWKEELDGLRKMKEQRRQKGYAPGAGAETPKQNPHRIRITYRELERMEMGSRAAAPEKKAPFFAKEQSLGRRGPSRGASSR